MVSTKQPSQQNKTRTKERMFEKLETVLLSKFRVLCRHTEFYSREGRCLTSELKATYLCHRMWSYHPHKLLLKSSGKTDFPRLSRKFPDSILNLSMASHGLYRLGQPCLYSSGHLLPLVQLCIFLRQFLMLRLYKWV